MAGYGEAYVEIADIDPRFRGELTRYGRMPVALSAVRGRSPHELRSYLAQGILPPAVATSTATGTKDIPSPAHVASVTERPVDGPDLHEAYVAHVDHQLAAARTSGLSIDERVDPMGGGTA